MKKLLSIFAIFSIVACLFSCEKKSENPSAFSGYDENELSKTVYADATTTGSVFKFTASESWNIVIDGVTKTENDSWVKVEPMSGGIGEMEIEISLYVNRSGEKRDIEIGIKAGESIIPIVVSQEPLTETGKEPELPVPSGTGQLTNGKTNETITLASVTHKINSENCVRLEFIPDSGTKDIFLDLYNPLSNGGLTAGTYNVTDQTTNNTSNGTCVWFKSQFAGSYGESGTVTVAVKGDVYTITANVTLESGGGTITGTFTGVFDYLNRVVRVSEVKLNENAMTLGIGESETLIASVLPQNATNKSCDWGSSDPTVATVDKNGVVTAKKIGSTTITAMSKSGSKTATCEVTVDATPAVAGQLTNEKTKEAINLVNVTRKEISNNCVRLEFIPDSGTKDIFLDLYNPHTDGITAGTYNVTDQTANNTSNGTCVWFKSGFAGVYGKSGTVKVKITESSYIITVNVTLENNEGTITGTYTGTIEATE